MSTYKTLEHEDFRLEILYDEDPRNPREDDNLGTMVCFHRRYELGDTDPGYSIDDYNSWAEMKADIIRNEKPVAILPLYLYDHGGITMNTSGFYCRWDSSQVGYIYVSRKAALENWGGKRVTLKMREMAEKIIQAEVEEYDRYLTGDVYGFRTYKLSVCSLGHIHEEETDSCWGFFGTDFVNNGLFCHAVPSELNETLAAQL